MVISAAISLEPYVNMENVSYLFKNSLQHIVERYVMVLQRVTVEDIMQTFDTLINTYCEDIRGMSKPILEVLLAAFENYCKDDDNDNAMFTAMSTLECVSSILMNACDNPAICDDLVSIVLPVIMVSECEICCTKVNSVYGYHFEIRNNNV